MRVACGLSMQRLLGPCNSCNGRFSQWCNLPIWLTLWVVMQSSEVKFKTLWQIWEKLPFILRVEEESSHFNSHLESHHNTYASRYIVIMLKYKQMTNFKRQERNTTSGEQKAIINYPRRSEANIASEHGCPCKMSLHLKQWFLIIYPHKNNPNL